MGQTQPVEILLSSAEKPDWVADIAAMHSKFCVNPIIRTLEPETLKVFLKFRLDFLKEELVEAYEAAGYAVTVYVEETSSPDPARAEDVVDAMIDLCVVSIGTLNAFDVDAHEAWNRVHLKNMEKEPGVNANRPNLFGFPDMIKPVGWIPPSHSDNIGLLGKIFQNA